MLISTKQLAQTLAGGDSYIRTKNGKVKGLALRLDKNPDAPDVIIVGKGPNIERNAKLFLSSGDAVPAYVKRRTNEWEFMGNYRATAYRCDSEVIKTYRHDRPLAEIAGILFLEDADNISVHILGGGFADPKTRKEVEHAAVEFVRTSLISQGYCVEDRQRENCGYDLLAVMSNQSLKIEVKGTDAPEPRFFITRNERSCAADDPYWRLAIVTSARDNPRMTILTGLEVESQFTFDPLAWECKQCSF